MEHKAEPTHEIHSVLLVSLRQGPRDKRLPLLLFFLRQLCKSGKPPKSTQAGGKCSYSTSYTPPTTAPGRGKKPDNLEQSPMPSPACMVTFQDLLDDGGVRPLLSALCQSVGNAGEMPHVALASASINSVTEDKRSKEPQEGDIAKVEGALRAVGQATFIFSLNFYAAFLWQKCHTQSETYNHYTYSIQPPPPKHYFTKNHRKHEAAKLKGHLNKNVFQFYL